VIIIISIPYAHVFFQVLPIHCLAHLASRSQPDQVTILPSKNNKSVLSLHRMASVDHHRDSQVSLSAIPQPDSKDKTSNFRNDRGFRHPPAFLINRRWGQRKIGQGQGYINDTSQTQPHESPDGTWDPERQEYYDANSYDGSRLYSWIWDPERLEWYYFSSLDGPRFYNTLNWDPHNRTYIHKNHDKHEDTYNPNPSGQGRESNDPASEAVTQTGYRPPSPLGPLPRKSLAMRLEWKKGDSGNTPTDVETDPIRITSATPPSDNSQDADHGSRTPNLDTHELPHHLSSETISWHHWREIHSRLPVDWKWDFEYHITNADHSGQHGSWTCTPLEPDEPKCYPLTIAGAPVVLPVEYRWPPESGVTPPPDPRATTPIDCRATLSLELVKDLFLTFQNSIGFYVLINGLLQVIVPEDYDTSWASSHLPHKYGGLKVCYIEQNLEPTMLPSATDTSRITASGSPVGSHDISGIFRPASLSTQSVTKYPPLKLNDFIEARAVSNHRRERFSGRVGLRVTRAGLEPLVVMSTHVITEAILAKSHRDTIFGRGLDDRFRKLEDDWNKHVEIWARDKKVSAWHISLITICYH
jgi:hypothetical protein